MVRISRLEIENVKRVQAVQIEPSESGLTILGGNNRQGKTSVLDAIMWALGGAKYEPSNVKREGSSANPRIQVELDNGMVVTRDGKNGTLKVSDPQGNKAGQALLDELIGTLALDLPKFLQAKDSEKAEILLTIIGVGPQLAELDRQEKSIYNERHSIGQIQTRKAKHAEDLPFEQGAPAEEVSASELIQQQQAILAKNAANEQLRQQRNKLGESVKATESRVADLKASLLEAEKSLAELQDQFKKASKSSERLKDESTAELEKSLQDIDDINRRVRINRTKWAAEAEAAALGEQVAALTEKLDAVRSERQALLESAELPLPGLSVVDGELVYQSKKWDCMSSADQLRVGVAIVRKTRPTCQFVLLDKLEQMDLKTLREFGEWLESEGLQAIATRVSTGGECSLIIEDGLVVSTAVVPPVAIPPAPVEEEGF